MYNLTDEQQESLVEIVKKDVGFDLAYADFVNSLLTLFEDVPGFESIPTAKAECIVNQLWRIYNGQESR